MGCAASSSQGKYAVPTSNAQPPAGVPTKRYGSGSGSETLALAPAAEAAAPARRTGSDAVSPVPSPPPGSPPPQDHATPVRPARQQATPRRTPTSPSPAALPDGSPEVRYPVVDHSPARPGVEIDKEEEQVEQEEEGGSDGDQETAAYSEEDVAAYAKSHLGLNPQSDCELLWIAREALHAELPDGWEELSDSRGEAKKRPLLHLRGARFTCPLDIPTARALAMCPFLPECCGARASRCAVLPQLRHQAGHLGAPAGSALPGGGGAGPASQACGRDDRRHGRRGAEVDQHAAAHQRHPQGGGALAERPERAAGAPRPLRPVFSVGPSGDWNFFPACVTPGSSHEVEEALLAQPPASPPMGGGGDGAASAPLQSPAEDTPQKAQLAKDLGARTCLHLRRRGWGWGLRVR
jgi:hypothetical protein